MPKVKINDIHMYYELHGEGEPIVLISGFSVDHVTWQFIVESLKTQYQVLLLDNRGSGQTDVPEGAYSIDQMAQDVVDLCTHLGIEKAHFVGNSMGGFIVQTLAHRHAERVKSAVIANSAIKTRGSCFHLFLEAQLAFRIANVSQEALMKSSFSWVFSSDFLARPSMLDTLLALGLNNPYPFTIAGFEGQYAAITDFDSQSWLKALSVPALVIGSDEDLIFSKKIAEQLHHAIPNAQYYCFENCGHAPHVEQPEQFVIVLEKFLSKCIKLICYNKIE